MRDARAGKQLMAWTVAACCFCLVCVLCVPRVSIPDEQLPAAEKPRKLFTD